MSSKVIECGFACGGRGSSGSSGSRASGEEWREERRERGEIRRERKTRLRLGLHLPPHQSLEVRSSVDRSLFRRLGSVCRLCHENLIDLEHGDGGVGGERDGELLGSGVVEDVALYCV